jgi:hypothetical protein
LVIEMKEPDLPHSDELKTKEVLCAQNSEYLASLPPMLRAQMGMPIGPQDRCGPYG